MTAAESIISEILDNYRENEWNRKNNESYETEQQFIANESEKIVEYAQSLSSEKDERIKALEEEVEKLKAAVDRKHRVAVDEMVKVEGLKNQLKNHDLSQSSTQL